jgi:hypothetical protein
MFYIAVKLVHNLLRAWQHNTIMSMWILQNYSALRVLKCITDTDLPTRNKKLNCSPKCLDHVNIKKYL